MVQTKEQLVITPRVARLLQTGFNIKDVERCDKPGSSVRVLADFLRSVISTEEEADAAPIPLPPEMHTTAREVAKLVVLSQLDHAKGLIESDHSNLLDIQHGREQGFVDTFQTLLPILTEPA